MTGLPVAIGILGLTFTSTATAQDAGEQGLAIAKKLDVANSGFTSDVSNVEMTLINAHGDRVERKMLVQTLEGTNDGDKSIVAFSFPADVNGTKLLTWTHKIDNDDQWLYMPAIKRIKRISSRRQSGSFMGSEFSYEDMSSQEVEKYTYQFLGDETLNGR
ncbi:MAG: outer membrane lipoprotein-sorting protein, partial [Myxococcota bacterium]